MTSPRIAVVVPCYNHGAYLPDALASVAAQTFRDFEVVVVDDGSDDPETRRVLDSLETQRMRVVRTAHRGLPAARNAGARETSAPLLCMVDADDRLAPEWLAKGVARLDADPGLSFVSHWLRAFGDEHWEWRPERCDFPALLARNTVNGAALVTRAAFRDAGGFDESFTTGCEDWDFWITLVERGHRGDIIPEVLFHYRRRPDSMSRVMVESGAQRQALRAMIAKHERTYREHLAAVVAAKEREAGALSGEIWDLELEHAASLGPALQQAEERLAALGDRVRRLETDLARERETQALRDRVASLEREVDALRNSWSWRLTAPLRSVYARLRGREQ
jgi:glycosyltransferase involved in cell wall biosynthesis